MANYFIALGNVESFADEISIDKISFIPDIPGMEMMNVTAQKDFVDYMIPVIAKCDQNNYIMTKSDEVYEDRKDFGDFSFVKQYPIKGVPFIQVSVPPQPNPLSFNSIALIKEDEDLKTFEVSKISIVGTQWLDDKITTDIRCKLFFEGEE